MFRHSDRFAEFVRAPHETVTRADILYNGEEVATDLAVVSGSVSMDAQAAVQRRASFTFAEPVLIRDRQSVLSPYGYEVRVSRGIVFPDGVEELIPLGVFGIQDTSVDGSTLVASLTTMDRSQTVADNRLDDAWTITSGTPVATAMRMLLDNRLPGLDFSQWTEIGFTTPALTYGAQDDPWAALMGMARASGHTVGFDGLGRPYLRQEPDLATAVAVMELRDTGTLTGARLSMSRASAYNKVIAYAANASNTSQFRAEAIDNDPASPTYYYGGFRRRPRFFASPLITSTTQAYLAAASILRSSRGVARSVDFTAAPHYALEPADAVLIDREALGVSAEIHLADVLTIGLAPEDAMTGASRARQTA